MLFAAGTPGFLCPGATPGCSFPGLCLLKRGGLNMPQREWDTSLWPRELKAGVFQVNFVYSVFICTLLSGGSKAFSCLSISLVLWTLKRRSHCSDIIFFTFHTLLSLACTPGLGREELMLTNCRCGVCLGWREDHPRTWWGCGGSVCVCVCVCVTYILRWEEM